MEPLAELGADPLHESWGLNYAHLTDSEIFYDMR